MRYNRAEMQVTFWGVRGSYPVPGPDTVRYGGHTSCVEVRSEEGGCLILDAGTGLRGLGQKLAGEQGEAPSWQYHVILSHVHWDHIQGLPFFQPAYMPGTRVAIYALRAAADELQQVIGGITRHEFFPVPLEAVPAEFAFHEVTLGKPFSVADFELRPIALNHPFGAVGYRIDGDGTSLAYVSDTAPFTGLLHKQHFLAGPETPSDEDRRVLAEMRAGVLQALRGVDTVIYDTQFLPEEFDKFPHWGHSTPDHALEMVAGNGVRRLVLYHHAPGHSDRVMDSVEDTYRRKGNELGVQVVVARERMTLQVGQVTDPGVGP
jgi:phosphoribosyl 1,2-cyclic phosphodiesterase